MTKRYFEKYRTPMDLVKSIFPFTPSDVYVNMVEYLTYNDDVEFKAIEDEYNKRFCSKLERKRYSKILNKPYPVRDE